MGHSNNMWLTDRCVLMHITFYEYSVCLEFKQVLYITLAKYLGQESIADLFLSRALYTVLSSTGESFLDDSSRLLYV